MTNLFSDDQLANFMPNFSEIDEGEEQQNQQQQSTNVQHLHVATSISHVKAPEFDGVNPRRWLKRFKAACDMNKWNDSQRINSLRQLMKENSVADSWFETRYKDNLPKTMEEFEKYLVADLGYPDEKEQKFKKMIDRTQEIGESPQDFYFHKLALIDDYGGIDDSFKVFLINNGLDSEYRDSLTLSCDSPDELLKILKKKEQAKQMAPQSIYPNLMSIGRPTQESDQPSVANQFMNLTNQDHNQNGQIGYGLQYATNQQNTRPRTYANRTFNANFYHGRPSHGPYAVRPMGNNFLPRRKFANDSCLNCHERGHFIRSCPYPIVRQGRKETTLEVRCTYCTRVGHTIDECRTRLRAMSLGPQSALPTHETKNEKRQ